MGQTRPCRCRSPSRLVTTAAGRAALPPKARVGLLASSSAWWWPEARGVPQLADTSPQAVPPSSRGLLPRLVQGPLPIGTAAPLHLRSRLQTRPIHRLPGVGHGHTFGGTITPQRQSAPSSALVFLGDEHRASPHAGTVRCQQLGSHAGRPVMHVGGGLGAPTRPSLCCLTASCSASISGPLGPAEGRLQGAGAAAACALGGQGDTDSWKRKICLQASRCRQTKEQKGYYNLRYSKSRKHSWNKK